MTANCGYRIPSFSGCWFVTHPSSTTGKNLLRSESPPIVLILTSQTLLTQITRQKNTLSAHIPRFDVLLRDPSLLGELADQFSEDRLLFVGQQVGIRR